MNDETRSRPPLRVFHYPKAYFLGWTFKSLFVTHSTVTVRPKICYTLVYVMIGEWIQVGPNIIDSGPDDTRMDHKKLQVLHLLTKSILLPWAL